MRTRALVLAGGGVTGVGWELGVLVGLRDAGVDVVDWALIVGTSAGSVVGAALGAPGHLDALVQAFASMDGDRVRMLVGRRDPSISASVEELWFGAGSSPDGPDRVARRKIGRLADVDDPELSAAYLA